MSWSQNEVRLLIDLYKQHPCLYAVKRANYKNKHARAAALEAIRQEIAELRPEVQIAEIKNKFSNLRTNFLTEHRKEVASQRSSAGTSEIYKPSLWYYDLIFILEHTLPRPAVDSIGISENMTDHTYMSQSNGQDDTILEDYDIENVEMVYDDAVDEVVVNTTLNSQNVTDTIEERKDLVNTSNVGSRNVSRTKKRKFNESLDNKEVLMSNATIALQEITNAITSNKSKQPPEQYKSQTDRESFASFVESQLKFLELDEDLYCDTQEQITNTIFKARRQLRRKKN